MCAKGESVDNIKQSSTTYEAKIEELENQILQFMAEKNDLEIKVEESLQDSGNSI
jgi:E3 ubiquitin-protein ligase BRE1